MDVWLLMLDGVTDFEWIWWRQQRLMKITDYCPGEDVNCCHDLAFGQEVEAVLDGNVAEKCRGNVGFIKLTTFELVFLFCWMCSNISLLLLLLLLNRLDYIITNEYGIWNGDVFVLFLTDLKLVHSRNPIRSYTYVPRHNSLEARIQQIEAENTRILRGSLLPDSTDQQIKRPILPILPMPTTSSGVKISVS